MIFHTKIFIDIRFWLLFFFVLRLYGITNPPLEIGHNWRQVTGIMVARNFHETDANILYPRIDNCEDKTGIIGMEFPVMNYIMYLASLFFGFETWYGRLINLIISTVGIFYFYKILKKYFSEEHAFYSSMLLLVSIWFAYSRKMMPDTFCISLFMISVYYGLNHLYEGKWFHLFLFACFGWLGVLSKIPAAYLFALFAIPFFDKQVRINRKIFFAGSSAVILLSMYWWYFLWCPHLSVTYNNWYNDGKTLTEGAGEIASNIASACKRFYFDAMSFTGFAIFLTGLLFAFLKGNKKIIFVFGLTGVAFFIYILKSGFFFYYHNYYIIPFVPVMCFAGGYGLVQISNVRFRNWALIIIAAEGIANQQHDFSIKDSEKYKLTLENIADKVSQRSDKIVINGESNPQQIFLTHRKGWTVENKKLTDETFINEIKNKNCKYIFVNKTNFKSKLNYPVVFENDFYTVYKL